MNAIVINEQLDLRQLSIDSLKTKFEYNVKNALSNEDKRKSKQQNDGFRKSNRSK